MLTFLVRCTHVGCYATEGLGWGGACYRSLQVAHMLDATQLTLQLLTIYMILMML